MTHVEHITKIPRLKLKLQCWSQIYPIMLVSGTITIDGKGDNDAAKRADERNKGVIFKNFHHSLTAWEK